MFTPILKLSALLFPPTLAPTDDISESSALIFAYTEIGFEVSPSFAIVCVIIVPVSKVIGSGSGRYCILVFEIVAYVELQAPNFLRANLEIDFPIFLKKLPIFFQNLPSGST